MQIDYECRRCNKFVKARLFRAPFKKGSGFHFRLDCTECKGKSFIKFIGTDELQHLGINAKDIGRREKVSEQSSVTNEELNFKLDLIISHLGL